LLWQDKNCLLWTGLAQVWYNKLASDLTKQFATVLLEQAVTTSWFHQTCCKLFHQTCYLLLVTGLQRVVSTSRYSSVVNSLRQTCSRKPVTAWRNQQTCRDLLTTCRNPVKSTTCDRPLRFLAV
jgi:hypothetical protein